jgi:hypothetical protein
MCRQSTSDRIQLGAANPDLGLLPAGAPPPSFRYISENEHQYSPSQARPVQLELRGSWKLASPIEDIEILARNNQRTIVHFNGIHGMAVRGELVTVDDSPRTD